MTTPCQWNYLLAETEEEAVDLGMAHFEQLVAEGVFVINGKLRKEAIPPAYKDWQNDN